MSVQKRFKIRDLILCALFAALIAVGAFIKIPIPPVPFSLQIFFAVMAGIILGPKRGPVCVSAYILLGLVGVPIFTKGGGPWYILEPTFGYMLGFILGAWIGGKIIQKRGDMSFKTMLIAAFLSGGASFLVGIPYFYLIMNIYLDKQMGIWAVVYSTFILFIPADTILMILAAWLGKILLPVLKKSSLV